jgi:hypothetical protein
MASAAIVSTRCSPPYGSFPSFLGAISARRSSALPRMPVNGLFGSCRKTSAKPSDQSSASLAGRLSAICWRRAPFADSCPLVGSDLSLLSLESKTSGRSPEVSSTAFNAQPLDLHSVPLTDVGFAVIYQLARTPPASHQVLVHRLASLLHATLRPHLAARPLRFAITSPPSGCEEDLHLQARHTKIGPSHFREGPI